MATHIRVGHAFGPEGSGVNGKAGDQTGREVRIDASYRIVGGGYHTLFRPKSAEIAEKSARACEAACNNPNVGYSQDTRTTLYQQAVKVNYDIAKINTPCNVDCSALMAVCVLAAGSSVSQHMSTHSMKSAFAKNNDYDTLTDNIYFKDTTYLRRGDILLKSGHTLMVLANGDGTSSPSLPDSGSDTVVDIVVPDAVTLRIDTDITSISTNDIDISVLLEKLKNGVVQSASFGQCEWSYTLKKASSSGSASRKEIGTFSAATSFSVSGLSANTTYILNIFTSVLGESAEIKTPNIVFTTAKKTSTSTSTTKFKPARQSNMIDKYYIKLSNGFNRALLYNNIRKA